MGLEAEDGEPALRIASAQLRSIDMLITDAVMPGMSGRALSKKLAEARPKTKVLYLSGDTEDAIMQQGVFEVGTAFLQKPFTLQMLSRKVRDVLRGSRG